MSDSSINRLRYFLKEEDPIVKFYRAMGGEENVDRAWNIHGIHYGDVQGTITDEDQAFYDDFVKKAVNYEGKPIGVCIWLAYAVKYVTKGTLHETDD